MPRYLRNGFYDNPTMFTTTKYKQMTIRPHSVFSVRSKLDYDPPRPKTSFSDALTSASIKSSNTSRRRRDDLLLETFERYEEHLHLLKKHKMELKIEKEMKKYEKIYDIFNPTFQLKQLDKFDYQLQKQQHDDYCIDD